MASIENQTSKVDQISSYLDSISANDVSFSQEAQWESLPENEKNEYLRLNERYLDLLKKTKDLNDRIEKLFNVAPYYAFKGWKFHTWVYDEWELQVSEKGEETYWVRWFQGLVRPDSYVSRTGDRLLSTPDCEIRPVLRIYGWANEWEYYLSTSEFEAVLDKIEKAMEREEAELSELESSWGNSAVIDWLR